MEAKGAGQKRRASGQIETGGRLFSVGGQKSHDVFFWLNFERFVPKAWKTDEAEIPFALTDPYIYMYDSRAKTKFPQLPSKLKSVCF